MAQRGYWKNRPFLDGDELAAKGRRVILKQLVVCLALGGLFLFVGPWSALSAGYGGLISLCMSLLLLWGVSRASEAAAANSANLAKSMAILYVGAVQRFVAVLVLLAIGLAGLKLDPLAVLVGFSITQASYVLAARKST